MRKRTIVAAGAGVAALALAARNGIGLRPWLVRTLAGLVLPDQGDPATFARVIADNRRRGLQPPPGRVRRAFDVAERLHGTMRVFHAARKGTAPARLRLLYLHGGAYVIELQPMQWRIVTRLLDHVAAEAVVPIYPLGPEATWRETMAALTSLYAAMVEEVGADNIVVVGDSAGGGLSLLLAQAARDAGLPVPRALVLFSPSLDLSGSGPDQSALDARDPMLSLKMVDRVAEAWAPDVAPDDPRISPLFASQEGLPPTMIFSSDRDILYSDAWRLKERNPSVEHRHYPGQVHDWVILPLREAAHALDEAGAFLRRHTAGEGR